MLKECSTHFVMSGKSCDSRFKIMGKSLKKILTSIVNSQIRLTKSSITKNKTIVTERVRGKPFFSIFVQIGYITNEIRKPNNKGTINIFPK
jgi:hypothetical protein